MLYSEEFEFDREKGCVQKRLNVKSSLYKHEAPCYIIKLSACLRLQLTFICNENFVIKL